jgi:hypothetical protein
MFYILKLFGNEVGRFIINPQDSGNTYPGVVKIERPKRGFLHTKIGFAIIATAIVIVVFSILLLTRPNLRATIFFEKFRTYSLVSSGNTYHLTFFKGATLKKLKGNQVLVAPATTQDPVPVFIGILQLPEKISPQYETSLTACASPFTSMAFKTFLPLNKSTISVCRTSSGEQTIAYDAAFIVGAQPYLISISSFTPNSRPSTVTTRQGTIISSKALSLNEQDAKTIISSIR